MSDNPEEMLRYYGLYKCAQCQYYVEPDENGRFCCPNCGRCWTKKGQLPVLERVTFKNNEHN